MKLNDLRPVLRTYIVYLCISDEEDAKYFLWGLDDETNTLAEYRLVGVTEPEPNDTMFKKYGNYNVEEMIVNKEGGLDIIISKDMEVQDGQYRCE